MPPADSPGQAYDPPRLPNYLRNVYDLKTIVGVPSDEEIIGIHAVIRTAFNVSHVPGMFDPVLSMHLSQHLFEVQMARYRDKHPFGMFSGDTVHTPPTLPSHVPITLQPVIGAPSDEEMQDVQAASRAYEHFANVPSMFDPRVSMELSQHLCNIQIARYMQHVALGRSEVLRVQSLSRNGESTRASDFTPQPQEPIESARDIHDVVVPATPAEKSAETVAVAPWPDPQQPLLQTTSTISDDQTYVAAVKESNRLLEKLTGTMDDMKRVMVATQNDFARGARSAHNTTSRSGAIGFYEMINDKGERPPDRGLPKLIRSVDSWWNWKGVPDEQRALYLRFYGIGNDLIENGDVPRIKDGKRSDAEKALQQHLE